MCHSATADTAAYDKNGTFVGNLVGLDNGNFDFPVLFNGDILFKLDGLGNIPNTAEGKEDWKQVYFTSTDCTGDLLLNAYSGVLDVVIRRGAAYYKTIDQVKNLLVGSTIKINYDLGGIWVCEATGTTTRITGVRMKRIVKPAFLPIAGPIKLRQAP